MEASTGIEPVYTDLQSTKVSRENKPLDPKTYQDKKKTNAEPDTARHKAGAKGFAKYVNNNHMRISRMLGYVLTLGDVDSWIDFKWLAKQRLTLEERAALAFAALTALDGEVAAKVSVTALKFMGCPVPSFLSPMQDARDWAAFASREELKAYALAAYEKLEREDQMAFQKYAFEVAL